MTDKISEDCLYEIPPIARADEFYSHSKIDEFFRIYAPGIVSEVAGNKATKIREYLLAVNEKCPKPLEVLGKFIKPVMEAGGEEAGKINAVLADCGLKYEGGNITKAVSLGILEEIRGRGSAAVNAEIERILQEINKDTMSAVYRAASLLEAAFELYLEKKQISFNEKGEFTLLWDKVAGDLKIRPKELTDNQNYQQIASALYSIIHGTRALRNSESAAHGKSEQKYKAIQIKPRHARLIVHTAGALANYVLECLE